MSGPAILGIRPVGPRAVRVEVADTGTALALARWARDGGVEATEVVPAARTVLLDGTVDSPGLRAALLGWRPGAAREGPAHTVRIPVEYDGPDLADVAARWGVAPEEVGTTLASADLVSAFCGFAPGFAYLAGLPSRLAVPRLDAPRSRVPAGAVALADHWCGIYPTASPGGWRVVGRTASVLWDQDRAEPALLPPGTRVGLVVAR